MWSELLKLQVLLFELTSAITMLVRLIKKGVDKTSVADSAVVFRQSDHAC